MNEILFAPESSSGVFDPLDFRVERFTARIGNPVLNESQNVIESALEQAAGFDHWFQPAA